MTSPATLGMSFAFAPRWVHERIAAAAATERLWANIRQAIDATDVDMERLKATGVNPEWILDSLCCGKTLDEVIAMERRIKYPSDRADQQGGITVVIPDDPEVLADGTRESIVSMREHAAKVARAAAAKPRIGHPKRNKARARMERNSRRMNRR